MVKPEAEVEPNRPEPGQTLPPWIAALALAALMAGTATLLSASSIALHWRFDQINPLDKAYFFQRVWQAAFGVDPCRTLLTTERGSGLWFGKHLNPVLAIYVPLVRWRPTMETLLAGQGVFLALGAIPAYALGKHATSNRLSGTFAALFWLTSPLLWSMAVTDFRTFNLAAPLLLACWAAVCVGRPTGAILWALAALSCREEVAWFLLVSLPALWWQADRSRRRIIVLVLAVTSLWLVLTVHTLGGFSPFLDLGDTLRQMAADLGNWFSANRGNADFMTRAWEALRYQAGATGAAIVVVLLAPIRALPAIANWVAVTYAPGLATPESYHYLAPTAAALLLAWTGAIKRIGRLIVWIAMPLKSLNLPPQRAQAKVSLGSNPGKTANSPSTAPSNTSRSRLPTVRHIWAIHAASALLVGANFAWLFVHPPPGLDSAPRVLFGTMRPETRTDSAWPLILRIPGHAPVLTDNMFISTLVNRTIIYDADEILDPGERQAVIDSVSWALLRDNSPWLRKLKQNGFDPQGTSGGAVLLRQPSPHPPDKPPLCFP